MQPLSQHLIAFLRREGLHVLGGASAAEVRQFEERYHVVIPADMRQCYLAVNGMDDALHAGAPLRLWSLSEIKPVKEELAEYNVDFASYDGFFVIADYWFWAHGYAIKLSDDPRKDNVVVAIGSEHLQPRQVASSFGSFLTRYLTDPAALGRD